MYACCLLFYRIVFQLYCHWWCHHGCFVLSHGEPLPSEDTISLYQIICVRKDPLLNKDTSLILVVIPFISTLKYIHRSPTYNGADDALMLSAATSSSSAAVVSWFCQRKVYSCYQSCYQLLLLLFSHQQSDLNHLYCQNLNHRNNVLYYNTELSMCSFWNL